MLTAGRRRWRTPAAVLAALLAAPAVAVSAAPAAQADTVRQQEQWVLNALDVAGAWQHTRGSGVTVALIDSGVNGQVSDLSGSVTEGRDFSGVHTPPGNANWGVHGTWMASLIAGHGHPPNGTSGITGVAPAARILSIRAVTDQGDPGYRRYQHESESRVQGHLADAIKYATSKRVSVISMSLGYQGASLPVRAAISAALARGIVVVASSGNSGGASSSQHGNSPYSFPANYPGVLGVGAVSQNGQPAGFSSDNLSVQVAAPGVRVPAQGRDGQYWLVSGTSPACALTAGVAALIKSVYPALAPALVLQAITASTSNKPHAGYDEQVGFGTVDATAALKMAGRLARDQGTGRGLVAAAQFGGGPAAIPGVPVTPRDKRQLLVDSLIALAFLVVVLVVTFRLIATRRPAVVGVPGGWSPGHASPGWGTGPGASPGWTHGPGAPAGSGGPARPGAPAGPAPAGPGPAGWAEGAGASGGWGAGSGAPGGRGGAGAPRPGAMGAGAMRPGAVGPGGAGPGGSDAGGTWPGGSGYGRSAGYWASGGYKPPAGPLPAAEYGFRRPANAGPPADSRSAGSYPPPADPGLAGGHQAPADTGSAGGYPPPSTRPERHASPEPPAPGNGSGPAGYRPPADYQPRPGFPGGPAAPGGSRLLGAPGGSGFPGARFTGDPRFPASPDGPTSAGLPGVPGFPGTAEVPGASAADLDDGPLAGYREATDPPGRRADNVHPADDDTWPSSGSR